MKPSEDFFTDEFGVQYNSNKTHLIKCLNKELKHYSIHEGTEHIEDEAFADCETLESLIIPESVGSIGNGTFKNCKRLKDIDIFEVVEIGDSAFEGCESLESIEIQCELSKSICRNCSSLKEFVLTEFTYEIPEHAFEGCNSLKEITLPENVLKIEKSAFEYCFSLEKVKFPNKIWVIDDSAFAECRNLKEINLPERLKVIGDNAFSRCGLSKIIIPKSVEWIGYGAFKHCSSLWGITLPEKIDYLDENAFWGCPVYPIEDDAPMLVDEDDSYAGNYGSMDDGFYNDCDQEDYERDIYYALGSDDYDAFRERGGSIDGMMDGLGF